MCVPVAARAATPTAASSRASSRSSASSVARKPTVPLRAAASTASPSAATATAAASSRTKRTDGHSVASFAYAWRSHAPLAAYSTVARAKPEACAASERSSPSQWYGRSREKTRSSTEGSGASYHGGGRGRAPMAADAAARATASVASAGSSPSPTASTYASSAASSKPVRRPRRNTRTRYRPRIESEAVNMARHAAPPSARSHAPTSDAAAAAAERLSVAHTEMLRDSRSRPATTAHALSLVALSTPSSRAMTRSRADFGPLPSPFLSRVGSRTTRAAPAAGASSATRARETPVGSSFSTRFEVALRSV